MAASPTSAPPRKSKTVSHKVVFLGQSGVGKTSLIQQFMYKTFDDSHQATVGMDFVSKVMTPQGKTTPVRLQLWDTAGQERFRSLIPGYLRDTSACIVVYDITSRASFESVRGWTTQALQERSPKDVVLALVGNKLDLEEQRAISAEEGRALASELQMIFFEASARTADFVDAVFDAVALALPAAPRSKSGESDDEIVLEPMRDAGSQAAGTSSKRKKCDC